MVSSSLKLPWSILSWQSGEGKPCPLNLGQNRLNLKSPLTYLGHKMTGKKIEIIFTFIYYYFQASKMCAGKCHKYFRIWKGKPTGSPPFYSNMCFSELTVWLSRKQNMKTNNQTPPVNDWWSEKATFDSSDVHKWCVCSWKFRSDALEFLQIFKMVLHNQPTHFQNCAICWIEFQLCSVFLHVFSPGDAFSNYRTTEGTDHSK